MTSLSVIIPAYNASSTVARLCDALARQDYPHPFEIIVVDDGSSDQTASVLRRYPTIRYVHQPNAGPASARNHGARLAGGDFLCFTDSDCVPHPDWISQLMAGFDPGTKVAVVMGSYGIANPRSILSRGIQAEIMFRHRFLMPDFPQAFGSYNFCIKKSVFWTVGGFDERYRRASGEDNDLSYNIIRAGHAIFFQRRALVDHHHTEDVLRYLKEQYRHGFWRASIYARHPAMAKGDGYTFWKDIIEMPWAGACFWGQL